MSSNKLPPELMERLNARARREGVDPQVLLERWLETPATAASLYVSAPVNALVEGLYREDTTIADILDRGDFGLGTFNDLDGEMVVLDGEVFQLRSDGRAYAVTPETRTPFACVTRFRPWSEETIDTPMDYEGLLALFDRLIPSHNMVYAIRLDGVFDYVRTRSVPRQDAYRPLVEVAREQPEYEFEGIEGSMAGFWTPEFMQSVAVPGYHLHFVDADRRCGGHLLEARPRSIRIALQHLPRVDLGLPMTLDYLTADLSRDTSEDLNEAEH
ncbi:MULTISPECIES: acetolactate decarboxylase [unclassified Thioalkalivibrio]|uniref:acetolactate decarboxylase n=1 Tax=unclassified Thioalkalivibrio TaxID=2621013 RepID=UPI0003A6F35A|nr:MULTISPECIES: acetolactate decarboxylase [unclassified Thioalkalivibrio]